MNEDASHHAADGAARHDSQQRDELLTVQPLRRGEQVILAGASFQVWLRLDLGDALRRGPALDYVVTVSARRLREGPYRLVGKHRGRLAGNGDSSVAVEVPSAGLPTDSYRLEAAVALLDRASGRPLGRGAFVEGVRVHAVPATG
jgi:hypothetical protein